MSPAHADDWLLAADFGATKTSLALYGPETELLRPETELTVANETVSDPAELISQFLRRLKNPPGTACFGVAGPVRNNRVVMTNRAWALDGTELAERFSLSRVTLINDLAATAAGVIHLPPDRIHTINPGRPDPTGTIGVIAPGTGLGQAFLVRCGHRRIPVPSEGGHSAFAPGTEEQRRLLERLARRHSHVSVEMVCSGRAIPVLFDFVRDEEDREPINGAPHQTRAIVEAALADLAAGLDTPARRALELFCAILAGEAANLSLKILATGGLYIGGGLAPRILEFLRPERFMATFSRGVYREMLTAIPIHVILEPKTALFGAAAHGRTLS